MTFVPYEQFGRAFVAAAATPQRIEDAVRAVAGSAIAVGPLHVGPRGAAKVEARGTVGAPSAVATGDGDASETVGHFIVSVPVALALTVTLAGSRFAFEAAVVARLDLVARPGAPLALVIDIAPISERDVDVDVRASGLVATVLGRLGSVEGEIREQVVAFITERVDSEEARAATVVDILPHLDALWHPGGIR